MKSFCIKNNNDKILNYLLEEIDNMEIDNVFISKKQFKHYKNLIIHYKGMQYDEFVSKLSKILTKCVIIFYEKRLITRILNSDYFYFNNIEHSHIQKNCEELLNEDDYEIRKEKIYLSFYDYIKENKFFILDGFVNFRLFEYKNQIAEIVDIAVNKYIIDKEYKEFIQLLQSYINSQKNRTGTIHVIYSKGEPILLDENENIIIYDNKYIQPKYLSDISFSSKDYCLNELLNLLPKKIILHLVIEPDEFVNTIQLIFKGRIIICKECSICNAFNFYLGTRH